MKVLLITPKMEVPQGGIAIWTEYYEKGCKNISVDYDIVNTVRKDKKRSLFGEIKRTKGILKSLKQALKNNQYDLAHLNTNIGNFGIIRDYIIAKKIFRKKIPIVAHFHCDVPFWVTNPLVKFFLKKFLKFSNKNLVLCENSKKYLKETFGVESDKIPNFLDEKVIVTSKKIREEIEKVVFVGRVSISKGAKDIYELAKRFTNIEFVLIGEVSQEVIDWEKPTNCNLIGPKPYNEVLENLDDSDLFLFPSHTEGFSLALAECMARGIPSIATDVGAGLDMLENKGGIVVDKGDIDAMEKALNRLCSPQIRKEMSEWCINKVVDNYTVDKVMEGLLDKYRSL